MRKIFCLLFIPLMLLPVVVAQQKPNGTGYPYLWFLSWTGSSIDTATGNITYTAPSFAWSDRQLSTITVRVDWGDGSSDTVASSGTWNNMNSAYGGFVQGLTHIYYRLGSYPLTVTLTDANNHDAQNSVIVNVSQGPNLSGVYGAGGRTPISL